MLKKMFTLVVCAILAGSLVGCASKYGEQKTAVNYYPGCYQPIRDLRESEYAVGKSTAGGALLGALGGALIGLLSGQGKADQILLGAAVGGATGSMAGYAAGASNRQADENRRMAAYMEQLDGDISNLDLAHAAARTSLQCYDSQFNALIAAIKERKISRQAAASRYAEISSGREEAIAILGEVAYQANELNQRYEQAFVQEERAAAQNPSARANTTAQRNRQLNAARKRKQTLSAQANDSRKAQQTAQATTASQTEELNNLMAQLDDIRR